MNGYNFTERVRKVLAMAREEAIRLQHDYVGTEHILLGLIREGEGVAAAVRCAASQRSNWSGSMTTATKLMSAWPVPQYSAHAPRKTPVRVGSRAIRFVRPGIMSILPPSAGIQKEWITSGLSS